MTKQDGRRFHEVQPKSSLSIPPGMRTYYQGLQDSMEQLVRKGRLQQFLYRPNGQGNQARSEAQGNASSRPYWGIINVIFATLERTGSYSSKVMSVAWLPSKDSNSESKRAIMEIQPTLSF